MLNVVISMAGRTLAESLSDALAHTGSFRSAIVGDGEDGEAVCAQKKADILLMGVCSAAGYLFQDRGGLCRRMRAENPGCRLVLLVDERSCAGHADEAVSMKRNGLLDAFVYMSSGLDYLIAVLESV